MLSALLTSEDTISYLSFLLSMLFSSRFFIALFTVFEVSGSSFKLKLRYSLKECNRVSSFSRSLRDTHLGFIFPFRIGDIFEYIKEIDFSIISLYFIFTGICIMLFAVML